MKIRDGYYVEKQIKYVCRDCKKIFAVGEESVKECTLGFLICPYCGRSNVSSINPSFFGFLGSGKGIHPWDGLKTCLCGGYPWMVGKDGKIFESGHPYKIICENCKKETRLIQSADDIPAIKEEWNFKLN